MIVLIGGPHHINHFKLPYQGDEFVPERLFPDIFEWGWRYMYASRDQINGIEYFFYVFTGEEVMI